MEPYTEEGMARQESEAVNVCLDEDSVEKQQQRDGNNSVCQVQSSETIHVSANSAPNKINYELVGIVVHSGQANAGHYYSYIKDRRYRYFFKSFFSSVSFFFSLYKKILT